jgi:lipopolysaccharide cholinephosphotransferase
MKKYIISDQVFQQVVGQERNFSLEDLHTKILEIYLEFQKICEKHDLKYWAEGGTWVGAMLCNKILPYDDDLDIRMPRQDYEKLKQIFKTDAPKNLELIDCTYSPYSRVNMLKIVDTNTTFIEKYKENCPMEWTGVFIDIVPLDGAPTDPMIREKLKKRGITLYIKLLLRKKNGSLLNLYDYRTNPHWYWLAITNNIRTYDNPVITLIKYWFIMLHPINYYAKRLDYLWQKYNNNASYFVTAPERPWEKGGNILYLKACYYSEAINQPFYDTYMPVPIGYKELSIALYGFEPRIIESPESLKKLYDGGYLNLSMPYKQLQSEAFSTSKKIQNTDNSVPQYAQLRSGPAYLTRIKQMPQRFLNKIKCILKHS